MTHVLSPAEPERPGVDGTCLRSGDGRVLALPGQRWIEPATDVDDRVLGHVRGPVLDVGCGPGRHVLALAQAGVVTLGIDISLPAVELARERGAPVLHRSIFERVPGTRRWGTALLLDGNVGIGGCPTTLLRRVASLLRDDGRLLIEVTADADSHVEWVRFEAGGEVGPWFRWAHVGLTDLTGQATAAGLTVVDHWTDGDRRFAHLRR